MKKSITTLLLFSAIFTQAQVGIGVATANIDASAQLEVKSTTKGFLPPRMLASEKAAIATPAAGLLVYQTDAPVGLYYYTGSAWTIVNSAATGSNFVDLTTAQTVDGSKTFSAAISAPNVYSSGDINVNNTPFGRPGGASNIRIGAATFAYVTSVGNNNTVLGDFAFTSSSGNSNTAIGSNAIRQGDGGSGDFNTAVGESALGNAQGGNRNTAIGVATLNLITGADNASLGYYAGKNLSTGNQNTFLGSNADVQIGLGTISNTTAIGYGANVGTSNTIQLGNSSVAAVNTSGTITAGTVKYPNTHNSIAGQVLTTNASGLASWATPASSGVPYTGATGVVDLGVYDLNLQSLTVGLGGGAVLGNTAFGNQALISNQATAYNNSAVGIYTLWSNTTGLNNTGLGAQAGRYNQTGTSNTSIGSFAMHFSTGTGFNTAVGVEALYSTNTGFNNTAIGFRSLSSNTTGSNNTGIGYSSNVASGALTNATAVGYGAIVADSNSIQLGNTSVTAVNTSGALKGGNTTTSTISGFSANMNTQTGTTYTLTTSDNGKIITLNNASAITLTVPTLFTGFNCMIVQLGAGVVTFTAGSGVTISNRGSNTKTAGTNAIATILSLTGTTFISSGDMSN
jgi:hypothetical protein